MASRVAAAVQERLMVVLQVAEHALETAQTGQRSECREVRSVMPWQISGKRGQSWMGGDRLCWWGARRIELLTSSTSSIPGRAIWPLTCGSMLRS